MQNNWIITTKQKPKRRAGRPAVWLYPDALERDYEKLLRLYLSALEEIVKTELNSNVKQLVETSQHERYDDWHDSLDVILATISAKISTVSGDMAQGGRKIGAKINAFNKAQSQKVIRSVIGVDFLSNDKFLNSLVRNWEKENLSLIKSVGQELVKNIEGIARRGVSEGVTARSMMGEIAEKLGISKNHALFIARDQTAKLNGQITRSRQENLGVTMYEWQSTRDSRTRDSHRAMNGLFCKWDDDTVFSDDKGKTWKKRSSIGGVEKPVGQDFQCRCVGLPVLDDIFNELGIT